MSIGLSSNRIYEYLKRCSKNPPNLIECRFIKSKMEGGLISQVIFSYGEVIILCILSMYEDIEDYEMCAKIRDAIIVHNRVNNTDIKR